MQLQLASIWQGFFSVCVQRWKVIFIGLISLKDNENRDCLQRLGPWKWSNQCFERALTAVGWISVCRNGATPLSISNKLSEP